MKTTHSPIITTLFAAPALFVGTIWGLSIKNTGSPLFRILGKCCSWPEKDYDDDNSDTVIPSLQEIDKLCSDKLLFP